MQLEALERTAIPTPFQDADLIQAYSELATALLAIVVAAATGVWAVWKWSATRRDERVSREIEARERREAEAEAAKQALEQRRIEERHRREDKAAELLQRMASESDPSARSWLATSLALYPAQAAPVLVQALAHATEDSVVGTLRLAIASCGMHAVEPLARLNNLAQLLKMSAAADEGTRARSLQAVDADQILQRSRDALAYLLLQATPQERVDCDLSGVDLSQMLLPGANLDDANFRKVDLSEAVLAKATLRRANLRGATLDGLVVSQAVLNDADLTGARGAIVGVRLRARRTSLDHADLSGSKLEGAQLEELTVESAKLRKSVVGGLRLADSTVTAGDWSGLVGRRVSIDRTRVDRADLASVDLPDLELTEVRFHDCRLTGANLPALRATRCEFVGCNLAGTRFGGAAFDQVVFRSCDLRGCLWDPDPSSRATVVFDSCVGAPE